MNLVSIQSHVVYGHVGNSAAVFPLQRMGVEVWPIHTVQFSNHTGYGEAKGEVFGGGLINDLMAGLEARGVLGECDGVLSGYMGSAEIAEAIVDAVATVRRNNPSARYACDPVIGDVGKGVFVRAGIPEFIKSKALPAADIVTPNQFELEHLTGRQSNTRAAARDAINALHDLGPRAVLVTSLHTDETPDDAIDMVASDDTGCYLLRTPRLQIHPNGAGDLTAALFFAHYLREGGTKVALAKTAASVFGILKKTLDAGANEIQVVLAGDEAVTPSTTFEVEDTGPALHDIGEKAI